MGKFFVSESRAGYQSVKSHKEIPQIISDGNYSP